MTGTDGKIENQASTLKNRQKGIDWQVVLDLKLKGLSHGQIGTLLGCSPQNIDYLVRQYGQGLDLVQTFKENRADLLATVQARLLDHLTEEKIEKMNGRDIAISYGVLTDKERLLRDQSTANIAVQSYARLVEMACEDGQEE